MNRLLVSAAMLIATISAASAAEPQRIAQRWAVLIGIDDYANANDLKYSGADQAALRERLLESGFRPENVILLHDKAAENRHRPSRGNIEQQLQLVINNAEADDLLVVAFSGHGVSVGGKSYLCPNDVRLGDPTTMIALDGVYDQLRDCAARLKWVLVDACRNDPSLEGGRSLSATEGTRQLARSLQDLQLPQGVVLLNSCAPGEISWEEKELGHGVFMHFVLEGLGGAADDDGDGAVSLNELQRYSSGRTRSYVIGRFNTSQRPFYRSEGENEVMDFALLPVRASSATAIKPADFTPLFNGRDLTGWQVAEGGTGAWTVEDGAVTCREGEFNRLLTRQHDFQDFHLRAEVMINDGGNGGLHFRTANLPRGGYEIQINSTARDLNRTGSLYISQSDRSICPASVPDPPVPPNTWFTLEVVVRGNHIQSFVNGRAMIDYVDEQATYSRGHIALEHHDSQSRVYFRKVEVKAQ